MTVSLMKRQAVHIPASLGTLASLAIMGLSTAPAMSADDHGLHFDPASSEYATADEVCDALNGTTALTVECWVKPDVVNNDAYFLAFNDSDYSNNIQLGIDGSGQLKIMHDDGVTTGSTMTAGEWAHVAVTIAADDTTIVYLNGVADITDTTTERPATDGYFSLAQEWDGGAVASNFFDGQIDELRVWDDVRTASEIRANMHRPLVGNEANLVAYLKLDEGTGTTLSDETGTVTDGTLISGTWRHSGANAGPGNALDFDGSQQYVEVANGSALIANQAAFTLECWVYPRTVSIVDWTTDFEGFVGIRNETDDFYLTRIGNTTVSCRLSTGGSPYDVDASVQAGEWQHYALVYDGSSLIVYRNGIQEDENTSATGQITDGTLPLRIGKQFYSSYHWPFDGLIDEVRLWTEARTVDEIRANMCRTLTGTETNLIAYYRFDQAADAGQGTLYDQTASAADGTLNNMDPATDWVASTAFNTWVGALSTAWTDSGNWGRGAAPVAADNISVPDYTGYTATVYQPTIAGDPTVHHCIVDAGGGMTFNGSDLQVSGNLFLGANTTLGSGELITVAGTFVNTADLALDYGTIDANGPFEGGSGSVTGGADPLWATIYLANTFDLGTWTPADSVVWLDGSSAQTLTGNWTFTRLVTSNAAGVDASGATLAVTDELRVQSGSFTGAGDLGSVDIRSSGAFLLSASTNVSGDWDNAGTFTHNNFGVTLDGTTQTITGDNTFATLTKTVGAADTLTFEGGSTTTVTQNLTLKGAAGQLLSLRGQGDAEWQLDPPDAGTIDMQYLDIKSCRNIDTNAIDLSAANCTDSGGNVKFIFATPTVTTDAPTSITTTTATSGGNVTDNGSGTVTARGVCWNTAGTPTIADSKTTDGTGAGTFTSSLTGLSPDTTYYVRAYATNGAGTAYGNQKSFTTTAEANDEPNEPADDADDEPNEPANEPNEPADDEPNEPGAAEPNAPVAAAPDLRVTIATSSQSAAVGEELTFQVDVANLGSADATDVTVRFPLPPGAEFVGAWLVDDPAAQAAPLDAYVEGDEIVVVLGDISAAQDMKLDVVLKATTAGAVSLQASATCTEQPAPATAQANTNVDVDDVYYEVLQTVTPINACGLFGIASPLLLTFGLLVLKRHGRRHV